MLSSDTTVQTYINELFFDGPVVVESLTGCPENPSIDLGVVSAAKGMASQNKASLESGPLTDVGMALGSTGSSSQRVALPASPKKLEDKKQDAFLAQFSRAQRGARAESVTRVDHRPEWGKESFSCLVFNVAGLKMAVPTQFIDGMQPLHIDGLYQGEVSLPGDIADFNLPNSTAGVAAGSVDGAVNDDQNPFYLGKMKRPTDERGRAESYSVIDTARLVMPERYDKTMQNDYRYALILKGFDWCFAVDAIGDELTLMPQGVRWRSEHTRREWLAGTVVDKMCALIDVQLLDRHLLAERVLS